MLLTRAKHKAGAQAYKQAINPGVILLSAEPASQRSSVWPVLPRPRSTEALLKFPGGKKEINNETQSYPFWPSRLNSWVLNSEVRKNPHHDLGCCFTRCSVLHIIG